MYIDDFLKLSEKDVKKYIKSCGIISVEEIKKSREFIKKLNLLDCSVVKYSNDYFDVVEDRNTKALIKTDNKDGLRVSIFYDYARNENLPNTPSAEIILHLYNNSKGKLGTVHWQESFNGHIYRINNQYFENRGEDIYIWKITKYSDYNTPWEYLQALREERKSLDPLLHEATMALYNGDLDSLFLLYTNELIDNNKNQFNAACLYSKMIYLGAKNKLSLEDAFVCFISELIYDKRYSKDEFTKPKKFITDYIENRTDGTQMKIMKFFDNLYSNPGEIEYIKNILLSHSSKDILKKEAYKRLQKQISKITETISRNFGLDMDYFNVLIETKN